MIIHAFPDAEARKKAEALIKAKDAPGLIPITDDCVLTKYQWALREYILSDLWFFCRVVLGMHWLDEDLHGRVLMSHYFGDAGIRAERDKATFIPRGHIKTLFLGVALNVWRVLRAYGLYRKDISILYASATEDLAKEVGMEMSGHLTNNKFLQEAFPDILPRSGRACELWGSKGYRLPGHSRKDHTLTCVSINTNVTGKHPDIIVLDDLIVDTTNNPIGWEKALQFIKNGLALLPPHGWFEVLGTRWHDSDPYGYIISDEIRGKQGPFSCMTMSCYEDDDPKKEPIWPARRRWNSNKVSGYTKKQFEDMRHTMGSFFNAQMRNDPAPEDEATLRISDINTYDPQDCIHHGPCRALGVDITGGGRLIYQLLLEEAEKLKIFIPIVEMSTPKRSKKGETKEDHIIAALEPVIREGRLWVREWMLPKHDGDLGNLGYEIKRIGSAKHDDIVDVLHLIIRELIKGGLPPEGELADFFIGCDLAYTTGKHSDWSVLMGVAVDAKGNHWIVDYERFRLNSPTGIVSRIIQFYQKLNATAKGSFVSSSQKSFGASYK